MRSEISITNLDSIGYAASAIGASHAIDVENGMSVRLDHNGGAGLVFAVKNTARKPKNVTIPATAEHLYATPLVFNVPPGGVRMIAAIDTHRHAGQGCIDFDFEAGFTGEVTAFRFPGRL